MKFKDYYEVLGIDRKASGDEIQKAFRKLARQFHPDVNKSKEAEDRFKEINEAYEVLKDDDKRQRYDALGANWKAGQDFRPPPGWEQQFSGMGGFQGAGQGGATFNFGGAGFSDFFDALFGAQGAQQSDFESLRRGGAAQGMGGARQPSRPREVRAEVPISVLEAVNGGSKLITVSDSSGGEGKTLRIKIPAHSAPGSKIRLAGKDGEPNIILTLQVRADARYSVEGEKLIVRQEIAPWEAALGSKVAVELPDGTIQLNIAAGTQSGTRLRVRGRGFGPKASRGDVLVEIAITVPHTLSDEEREAYEKLKAAATKSSKAA